jgi:uncharacterized protein
VIARAHAAGTIAAVRVDKLESWQLRLLAMDEKDRFGDKLRDAERAREDIYFAERDRELLEKLRRANAGETESALKEAAHMRCPKCGTRLQQRSMDSITVEDCPSCRGLWIDQGELEKLTHPEKGGWFARWLQMEFTKPE